MIKTMKTKPQMTKAIAVNLWLDAEHFEAFNQLQETMNPKPTRSSLFAWLIDLGVAEQQRKAKR